MKKMTLKRFKNIVDTIKSNQDKIFYLSEISEDEMHLQQKRACEKVNEILQKEIEHLKVNVKYSIGGRQYFNEAYKIGTKYFNFNFTPMNKSNHIYTITEIPEITDKMKEQMLDDMYYY